VCHHVLLLTLLDVTIGLTGRDFIFKPLLTVYAVKMVASFTRYSTNA